MPLASALSDNATLGLLLQRLRQSQARLDSIRTLLPPTLHPAVQAGPLDDAGWSLLVAHPSAAAKIRQMLPQLQAGLVAAGWSELPIRLRVRRPTV